MSREKMTRLAYYAKKSKGHGTRIGLPEQRMDGSLDI